ncbi:MAG: glutamine amidotransferase, partial [Solirubrobacteraceae bacterium]
LVDLDTKREDGPRLLGNIAISLELPGGPTMLAGFENHAGRTYLGEGTAPLGRVVEGHGNNGRDGTEGVRGGAHGTVVGTYMHGPLLPKNTAFADWLTRTALGLDALPPLDDALEDAAHAEAARAAGVGG